MNEPKSPPELPNLGQDLLDTLLRKQEEYNKGKEERDRILIATSIELARLRDILRIGNTSIPNMPADTRELEKLYDHNDILKHLQEKILFFEKQPNTERLVDELRALYTGAIEKHENWQITLAGTSADAIYSALRKLSDTDTPLPDTDVLLTQRFYLGNGAYPPAVGSTNKELEERSKALRERARKRLTNGDTDDDLSLQGRFYALSNPRSFTKAQNPSVGTPQERADKAKWRADTKAEWKAFREDYNKYEEDCMDDGCEVFFRKLEMPGDLSLDDFHQFANDLMEPLDDPRTATNPKLLKPQTPQERDIAQAFIATYHKLEGIRQSWGPIQNPQLQRWESKKLTWIVRNGSTADPVANIATSLLTYLRMRALYEVKHAQKPSKSKTWAAIAGMAVEELAEEGFEIFEFSGRYCRWTRKTLGRARFKISTPIKGAVDTLKNVNMSMQRLIAFEARIAGQMFGWSAAEAELWEQRVLNFMKNYKPFPGFWERLLKTEWAKLTSGRWSALINSEREFSALKAARNVQKWGGGKQVMESPFTVLFWAIYMMQEKDKLKATGSFATFIAGSKVLGAVLDTAAAKSGLTAGMERLIARCAAGSLRAQRLAIVLKAPGPIAKFAVLMIVAFAGAEYIDKAWSWISGLIPDHPLKEGAGNVLSLISGDSTLEGLWEVTRPLHQYVGVDPIDPDAGPMSLLTKRPLQSSPSFLSREFYWNPADWNEFLTEMIKQEEAKERPNLILIAIWRRRYMSQGETVPRMMFYIDSMLGQMTNLRVGLEAYLRSEEEGGHKLPVEEVIRRSGFARDLGYALDIVTTDKGNDNDKEFIYAIGSGVLAPARRFLGSCTQLSVRNDWNQFVELGSAIALNIAVLRHGMSSTGSKRNADNQSSESWYHRERDLGDISRFERGVAAQAKPKTKEDSGEIMHPQVRQGLLNELRLVFGLEHDTNPKNYPNVSDARFRQMTTDTLKIEDTGYSVPIISNIFGKFSDGMDEKHRIVIREMLATANQHLPKDIYNAAVMHVYRLAAARGEIAQKDIVELRNKIANAVLQYYERVLTYEKPSPIKGREHVYFSIGQVQKKWAWGTTDQEIKKAAALTDIDKAWELAPITGIKRIVPKEETIQFQMKHHLDSPDKILLVQGVYVELPNKIFGLAPPYPLIAFTVIDCSALDPKNWTVSLHQHSADSSATLNSGISTSGVETDKKETIAFEEWRTNHPNAAASIAGSIDHFTQLAEGKRKTYAERISFQKSVSRASRDTFYFVPNGIGGREEWVTGWGDEQDANKRTLCTFSSKYASSKFPHVYSAGASSLLTFVKPGEKNVGALHNNNVSTFSDAERLPSEERERAVSLFCRCLERPIYSGSDPRLDPNVSPRERAAKILIDDAASINRMGSHFVAAEDSTINSVGNDSNFEGFRTKLLGVFEKATSVRAKNLMLRIAYEFLRCDSGEYAKGHTLYLWRIYEANTELVGKLLMNNSYLFNALGEASEEQEQEFIKGFTFMMSYLKDDDVATKQNMIGENCFDLGNYGCYRYTTNHGWTMYPSGRKREYMEDWWFSGKDEKPFNNAERNPKFALAMAEHLYGKKKKPSRFAAYRTELPGIAGKEEDFEKFMRLYPYVRMINLQTQIWFQQAKRQDPLFAELFEKLDQRAGEQKKFLDAFVAQRKYFFSETKADVERVVNLAWVDRTTSDVLDLYLAQCDALKRKSPAADKAGESDAFTKVVHRMIEGKDKKLAREFLLVS